MRMHLLWSVASDSKTRTAWNCQKVIGEKAERWTLLRDGLGALPRGTSPPSRLLWESILRFCKERKKSSLWNCLHAVWKLVLVLYSAMCYSPPLPSLGTYELNFVCTFTDHQLGKERHSMESSFVAFCDLLRHATDVTCAICSTDVQIHSVGWQLNLTEQILGKKKAKPASKGRCLEDRGACGSRI